MWLSKYLMKARTKEESTSSPYPPPNTFATVPSPIRYHSMNQSLREGSLSQLPDEIKVEILKHLFSSTNVYIKPACQEKHQPRRGTTKLPHLTFEAISRTSKNFYALSKPLYFPHTKFIFRQCFCPICVAVGERKLLSRSWKLNPNIQHLNWYRSDWDYGETTNYWDKKYWNGVESLYLNNHIQRSCRNLKSLALIGEWAHHASFFMRDILSKMAPIRLLQCRLDLYGRLHDAYYPIKNGRERTPHYQIHESFVEIIDGRRLMLYTPDQSLADMLKREFDPTEDNNFDLITKWVKEPRHCLICGLPGWKILLGHKCTCDLADPYLEGKATYTLRDWANTETVERYW